MQFLLKLICTLIGLAASAICNCQTAATPPADSSIPLNRLRNWINSVTLVFPDSSAGLSTGWGVKGDRRQEPISPLITFTDTAGHIQQTQLKNILRVDSSRGFDDNITVFLSLKSLIYSGISRELENTVFDDYELSLKPSLKILFSANIGEYDVFTRLFVKTAFIFETSMKNIRFVLKDNFRYANYTVTWSSQVHISDNRPLTPSRYTWSYYSQFERIFAKSNPILLSLTLKKEYDLPENYEVEKATNYDKIIRQFLEGQFAGVAKEQKLFLDDFNLKICNVNGLISKNKAIWENIEINLIANIHKGKLKIIGVFDGDCANSRFAPARAALTEGQKLDITYPDELKGFGNNLITELYKILIK